MLNMWIEFFEDLKIVRGRSDNTIAAYRRDLLLYEEFKSQGKSISSYYNFLNGKGLSDRSQARAISSLRTYLKFLERNDLPAPELRELKLPKVTKKAPQSITYKDFEKLLEASKVEDLHKTKRNHTLLYLMFGLGLRVSEVIALNVESFKREELLLFVLGKGNKERVLPVNSSLGDQMCEYLDESRSEICSKDDNRSLIINEKSNRPSRIDIWRWFDAWSKKAGFKERIHPHQFRHGCATTLLENGANLRAIQVLLGHTSLQTTQMYTKVSKKHLKEALEEHHPLAGQEVLASDS